MKNVLVLIHEDDGQEARIQAALDLVRAIDGHLTCLDVVGSAFDAGIPSLEGTALLLDIEEKAEASNRARIGDRLSREDVPWSMSEAEGSFAACLAKAGELADLIVLNPELGAGGPDMIRVGTDLLVKARRPLLVVPADSRGFDVCGNAMVAWDGSLPAMAAVGAAVPLLRLAASVRILEVQGSSHGGVQECATYLSRHGIAAEIDRVACFAGAPHETSDVIQEMAEKARCSWCVMGAYGHSPLREALLGGTTRRMLASARLPIFLAH